MCHCSNLYYVYDNNYNNNYSFVILICLQPFCRPHLYFILHTTQIFKHSTSHKADWITTDCCLLTLALLHVHVFTLQNVVKEAQVEFSRKFAYVHSHTCLSRMIVAVSLFGWYSMHLCCVHTNTCYIFFLFLPKIFIAFAYCFHVYE